MNSGTIFQASELATRRVDFLEAARSGSARLRDKDGTGYVMVPESRLEWLQQLVEWGSARIKLVDLLQQADAPTVSEFGNLAWLRVFDRDDIALFAGELQEALVASRADGGTAALDECVADWRLTAQQLSDPLRRSILLNEVDIEEDSVELQPFDVA